MSVAARSLRVLHSQASSRLRVALLSLRVTPDAKKFDKIFHACQNQEALLAQLNPIIQATDAHDGKIPAHFQGEAASILSENTLGKDFLEQLVANKLLGEDSPQQSVVKRHLAKASKDKHTFDNLPPNMLAACEQGIMASRAQKTKRTSPHVKTRNPFEDEKLSRQEKRFVRETQKQMHSRREQSASTIQRSFIVDKAQPEAAEKKQYVSVTDASASPSTQPSGSASPEPSPLVSADKVEASISPGTPRIDPEAVETPSSRAIKIQFHTYGQLTQHKVATVAQNSPKGSLALDFAAFDATQQAALERMEKSAQTILYREVNHETPSRRSKKTFFRNMEKIDKALDSLFESSHTERLAHATANTMFQRLTKPDYTSDDAKAVSDMMHSAPEQAQFKVASYLCQLCAQDQGLLQAFNDTCNERFANPQSQETLEASENLQPQVVQMLELMEPLMHLEPEAFSQQTGLSPSQVDTFRALIRDTKAASRKLNNFLEQTIRATLQNVKSSTIEPELRAAMSNIIRKDLQKLQPGGSSRREQLRQRYSNTTAGVENVMRAAQAQEQRALLSRDFKKSFQATIGAGKEAQSTSPKAAASSAESQSPLPAPRGQRREHFAKTSKPQADKPQADTDAEAAPTPTPKFSS